MDRLEQFIRFTYDTGDYSSREAAERFNSLSAAELEVLKLKWADNPIPKARLEVPP